MIPAAERTAARAALRRSLRARRREIDPAERLRRSYAICAHALGTLRSTRPLRIALYHSLPEEVDTGALLALLATRGHAVYLPRIVDLRAGRMRFFDADAPARPNRYGILEPCTPDSIAVTALDVAFVPLVGFDRSGSRLGMGAGFYDRAFAFRRHRLSWLRPRLVGLAFACQEVDELPVEPHDVRLDAVVTEHGLLPVHVSGASR